MSAAGGRLRAARWIGAGLADQVVSALANAGTTLLGAVLLARHRGDHMLLAVAVGYAVIGLGRAVVGEVLLALAARAAPERRRELVRHALTAALVIGAIAGVLLFALAEFWPSGGRINLGDVRWVAPFLPALLVHDAGRYTFLADRRPAESLRINLAYAGSQALLVVLLLISGLVSGPSLIAAWGVGACIGAMTFCLRTRQLPWRGRPQVWFQHTRFLSGWFTATAVVAQAHGLAINFLVVGRLPRGALPGFKLAQTTLLQPVQNVNQALISLLVPRYSRLSGAVTTEASAARRLRRDVFRFAAVFAVLAACLVAIGAPLGGYVLSKVPRFADVAPLALPIVLQGGIYLVQAPFTAALRGMHRARSHFAQYVIFGGTSLVGLVVGASRGGLAGATWGLTVGSAVGLATSIALYLFALRGLGGRAERFLTEPDPEPDPLSQPDSKRQPQAA